MDGVEWSQWSSWQICLLNLPINTYFQIQAIFTLTIARKEHRICSDYESFDKRCNDLEGWLMEREYNGKMIRKQILRAQEHSRNDLLEREKAETSEPKLTFNITYYPVFQNIRNILQELHLLLAIQLEQPYLEITKPGNVNHVGNKPVQFVTQ